MVELSVHVHLHLRSRLRRTAPSFILFDLCDMVKRAKRYMDTPELIMQKWKTILLEEGFRQQWSHRDQAGYFYDDHEHPVDTAHVVLQGSMTIEVEGQEHEVGVGERFDVAKHVVHRAKIGPRGCEFLIGVRV